MTEIRYPNGSVEKREYDKGGRLKRITNPMGVWEEYAYDGNGNIIEKNTMAGGKYVYAYDYQNRLTAMTAPTGGTRSWEYDVMGRVTALTDENGNRTEYEYSPNGNLISVRDAMGNVAYYDYDTMGHLTAIFRADDETGIKQKTTYLYDLMGLPSVVTDALGYEEYYQYNLNGKMIRKTDRDGYVTGYAYNALGQIKQINYADGRSVCYEYDALKHLKEVVDWNGKISIKRDLFGRIEAVTDSENNTVEYQWRSSGERKRLVYPDGKEVQYEYNEFGRLTELIEGNCKIRYKYNKYGQLLERDLGNGNKTTYTYNEYSQLSSLINYSNQDILDSYTYQYDLKGNRTEITKFRKDVTHDNGKYHFSYDKMNRLCEVKKDNNVQTLYKYDSYGNRIEQISYTNGIEENIFYKYNSLNQLIQLTSNEEIIDYYYDNRGNLKEIKKEDVIIKKYYFGAMNRMTHVWSETGMQAWYEYNGLGHRIQERKGENYPEIAKKYSLDLTKEYNNLLWEKEDLLDVENFKGIITQFIWDKNVAIMEKEGKRTYFMQDELGSPVRIMNEDNESIATYGYDEFGKETYGNADNKQPFTYVGYRKDDIADTYFAQAREYMPERGSFISEDWIKGNVRVPMSLNKYNYCCNNSLNYVDRNGKKGYYFYSDNFETRDTEDDVDADIEQLEKEGYEVEKILVQNESDFVREWNMMDDSEIDFVIVYTHSDQDSFMFTDSSNNSTYDEKYLETTELEYLQDKQINFFITIGCNGGGEKNGICMAEELLNNISGISYVVAADRKVWHGSKNGIHTVAAQTYSTDMTLKKILSNFVNSQIYNHGFQLFSRDEKKIHIGDRFKGVTDILNTAMYAANPNDCMN